MNEYDLIIIGGGAGAFASAIKANDLGAKTLMVNKGLPLGGTCVNVGCVPSKTLLWAGEVMHQAMNHGIPGIDIEVRNFDFASVVQHELDLVEKLREEKYEKVLRNLENVTHLEGRASFVSANEIEVNGQNYKGKKFVIAAGSTTTVFGTKVTVLQRSDSIFSPAEKELTARLAEILTDEGITIKTNVRIKSARKEGNKKILTYAINDKEEEVLADEILLATGKTPNTQELNLNKAGVNVDDKLAIKVTPQFQTSQPHIFAVGDVTNLPIREEPTAGKEGTLATENALKDTNNSIDYHTVPWTIFTDPQLAGVGFSEDEQMKRFGTCMCKTVAFTDVPKARILGRTEGLIKMAIHPETKQIMGVHILAPNAGDLIAQAMWLVKNKNTVDDVVNSLPMFPTLSEAIKIAALSFTKDISKLSCCV